MHHWNSGLTTSSGASRLADQLMGHVAPFPTCNPRKLAYLGSGKSCKIVVATSSEDWSALHSPLLHSLLNTIVVMTNTTEHERPTVPGQHARNPLAFNFPVGSDALLGYVKDSGSAER